MKPNKQNNSTFLFVDGTNLYASQFKIFGPHSHLDFTKLIKELENKLKIIFNQIYFYASYSPRSTSDTKKTKLFLKNEDFFYKNVKETTNLNFFKGYRSKTSGKEKEVDVKLAVDIVKYAYEKKYNNIYLLTGDADFLQALYAIQHLPISINIICIENTVMFKGAFYFNTKIIDFTPDKLNITIDKKQKIKILEIPKASVSKKIPRDASIPGRLK
jgi:uncharacterized LabA/DUF88 family protein